MFTAIEAPTNKENETGTERKVVICMTCYDDAIILPSGEQAYCSRCKTFIKPDGNRKT